jgi:hypothetical protein
MPGVRVGHRWYFAHRAWPTLFRVAPGSGCRKRAEPQRPIGSAHLSRFSEIPT